MTPPPVETPPPPPSRVPVFVAGGVAVAAFAASAVFFVLRGNKINETIETGGGVQSPDGTYACKTPGTEQKIKDLTSQGQMDLVLSGVFLGVGAAGVATATGFLIASAVRKPAPATTKPKATVTVVPMGMGVQVLGSF